MSGDQVPLPFVVNENVTLTAKGDTIVHIKTPGEALSKRQFTGHVHFADRPWRLQPRAVMVCRGLGKRLSESEKLAWDPRILVMFQKCAWVDRPLAKAIAKACVEDEEERMGLADELMYNADRLDAQTRMGFKSIFWEANGLVTHPPGGLTHQLAAVDRGYGRKVKHETMVCQDEWCDADPSNYDKWESAKLTASERRILMSHWFAEA